MRHQKKILIITYYWPPSGGVGVQRWMHFARNLKDLGWEPVIYTPSNPQFDIQDQPSNAYIADIETWKHPIWEPVGLFHRLTGGKERVRQGQALEKSRKSRLATFAVWLRGNLFIPDPKVFWVSRSVKLLKERLSDEFAAVITTGPPHSMHLIGLRLKSTFKEIKWIADFRDPWSEWDILSILKTSNIARYFHKRMERQVLLKADKVITVSNFLADDFRSKTTRNHVEVINNGIQRTSIPKATKKKNDGKFRIGYFGLLNELRNPDQLWQALEELCDEDNDFKTTLRVTLAGIVSDSIKDRLLGSPLGEQVALPGYLPHARVLEEYGKCDILLLILNKTANAKWILPVKFFEYLTAKVPILGLGPQDSELASLINPTSVGKMISHTDKAGMKSFILSVYQHQYKPKTEDYDRYLHDFSKQAQTQNLIRILEE